MHQSDDPRDLDAFSDRDEAAFATPSPLEMDLAITKRIRALFPQPEPVPPGRPPKGAVRPRTKPAPTTELGRPATEQTLENWRTGVTSPDLKKLAATIIAHRKAGSAAAPLVLETARRKMDAESRRVKDALEPALQESGVRRYLEIEHIVAIRTRYVEREPPQPGSPAGLASTAGAMMAQSTDIGWLTSHASGLRIMYPSRPAILLLGIDNLEGMSLLDPKLALHIASLLENPCEWLLTIGLLGRMNQQAWRDDGQFEYATAVDRFHTEVVLPYLKDHEDEAISELESAPAETDEGPLRETLAQCLLAVYGEIDWPAHPPSLFNSMRMHIAHHSLLPPGVVARFRKKAIMIREGDPRHGYIVLWGDEPGDLWAPELRKRIHRAVFAPPIRRPNTRYASSGGAQIAYQVVGEQARDLLLIPGWVSHLDLAWEEASLSAFYDQLAEFSRLILFDKRGTGLSDPGRGVPTMDERVNDLRSVLDATGAAKTTLLGVSEGGALAATFAARFPERVDALVIYGSLACGRRNDQYPWAPTEEEDESVIKLIDTTWGGPFAIEQVSPSMADNERYSEWWARFLRSAARKQDVIALHTLNAHLDVRELLSSIRVPTLVLHRAGDRIMPFEGGKYLARAIPNARFVELVGDDHVPWVGDSMTLIDQVRKFLFESWWPQGAA